MPLPIFARRLLLIAWDVASWLLAFLMFAWMRYKDSLTHEQWVSGVVYTAIAIVLQVVGGLVTQTYLGRSRVGSFEEASFLGASVGVIAIGLGSAFIVVYPGFPRGLALAIPALAVTFMAAGRWMFRVVFRNELRRGTNERALSAVVYGAGDAGHQVARLVDMSAEAPYRIVGFVDDNPGKRFLRLRGYRVLGQGRDVVDVARAQDAEIVIMAISSPGPHFIQALSDRCTTCLLYTSDAADEED